MIDSNELKYFRKILSNALNDILKNSQATLEEMTGSVEIYADPADRATAESDRTFILRLRDRERKLIKKIQKAIQRIDNGEFGICQECSEEIHVARLKARPMTTLCITCKSKQEADEHIRSD